MNIYIKEGGYHSYLFCVFKDGLIKKCNLRKKRLDICLKIA